MAGIERRAEGVAENWLTKRFRLEILSKPRPEQTDRCTLLLNCISYLSCLVLMIVCVRVLQLVFKLAAVIHGRAENCQRIISPGR